MSLNFTGQNIKDTYQRVVQYDSKTGDLYDGTGSLVFNIVDNASQRATQSAEISVLSSSVSTLTDATSSYAIVGGSNTFTGLQTFSSGVTINGIATEFNSRVSINGNTTIGDRDTDTLEVNAQSTFNETLQVQSNITASGHVSASTYYGDGSNLTGISSDPFPYTGSAIITGSLEVIGDVTGSKFIFKTADYNYLNARIRLRDYNTGISITSHDEVHFLGQNVSLMGMKNASGIPQIRLKSNAIFGFTSANTNGTPQVNLNRLDSNTIRVGTGGQLGNHSGSLLLTNLTAAGHVSASTYYGDGSNLTGISSDPFPYTGSAVITGSLVLTGSIKPNGGIKIGLDAGANNNNGGTIAIGNNALSNHSTGYTGIAIGNEASRYASQPNHSVAIGDYAGRSVGVAHYTVYVGRDAGYANTGYGTIGIGMRAARTGTGGYNTSIGWESLYNNTGGYNVAVGLKAGGTWGASTTISNSTLLGPYAGTQINGDNNIALGQSSGYYASGSNNILLGYQAGYNLTGSNQLIIANTGSHALVTGDFANNTFDISGSITAIGSNTTSEFSSLTIQNSDGFNILRVDNDKKVVIGEGYFRDGTNTGYAQLIFPDTYTLGGQINIGDDFINASAGQNQIRIGSAAGRQASVNKFIAIGDSAGQYAGGSNGIYMGFRTGWGFRNPSNNNVVIGHFAASANQNHTGGHDNTILGTNAATFIKSGPYNTIIGKSAGYYIDTGSKNTYIGHSAGYSNVGHSNVLLGYQAGYNLTGSNQLIIANTGSHALVTGDFANNTFNISGSVSASTYYGDGSNLSGISSTPFPFEGDAVITGSLTVSGSVVDFTSASAVNINLESLSLVNPIVEYLDVTASISSGTSITLPNNLSYVSSSVYEYLEVFMNGLRLRYNRDFVPTSNTTIQNQMHFPSGSELTFKSLKR